MRYIETDTKAAFRNEATGSSLYLTQYVCLLKKQVGIEVQHAQGKEKCACAQHIREVTEELFCVNI